MKAKLAGLFLITGLPFAAQAATYHFTPITEPHDPSDVGLAVNLGNQLTMDVTDTGNNTALFTFTNGGSNGGIQSSLAKVFFDDRSSSLFSNLTIANDSGPNVTFEKVTPSTLRGGNIPTFSFKPTAEFDARTPYASNGVNTTTSGTGEFLSLAASLNGGRSFADVISSLNGGNETNQNFLRVGLRLTSIDALAESCDDGLSFLDKGTSEGGGAGSPPPIPEPETYGMLLAGLGLVSTLVRRGKKKA